MSEEELTQHIQIIRQQIEALSTQPQQQVASAMEEITASLGNLQVLAEKMQASLEAMEMIQEELLGQNEYLAEERQHYYDLFTFAPDAYLLTNAQGMILYANRAASGLFNVMPEFLIGKPLVNFVTESERSVFRTKLNQLSQAYSYVQEWELVMCPRGGQPFNASLLVGSVRDSERSLVSLRLGIRNVTKYKQAIQQLPSTTRQLQPEGAAVGSPMALDGLQVLFVDDEADARESIATVLEQHGICVTAVASVAQALEVLERSRPDVLLSDIRMPDEDGYALIKKLRALEAQKGWQIPAAALSAYLTEDRAKALKAGFQSHLHKLAEPTKLIAMVAQLAGEAESEHLVLGETRRGGDKERGRQGECC